MKALWKLLHRAKVQHEATEAVLSRERRERDQRIQGGTE